MHEVKQFEMDNTKISFKDEECRKQVETLEVGHNMLVKRVNEINTEITGFEGLIEQVETNTSNINRIDGEVTSVKERTSNVETTLRNIVDVIYPVGSLYLSVNNVSPNVLFGGTWEQITEGVLMCSDSGVGSVSGSDTKKFTVSGSIGGTSLTTAQLPSHNHSIPSLSGTAQIGGSHTHSVSTTATNTGDNGSHNHAPSSGSAYGFLGYKIGGTVSRPQGATGSNRYIFASTTQDDLNYSKNTNTVANHNHYIPSLSGTTQSSGSHTHSVSTTANTSGSTGSGNTHTHTFTANECVLNVVPKNFKTYVWKRVS